MHAQKAPIPLSKTTQAPAAPPSYVVTSEKEESPEELEKRMRGLMNQSKVVLFMKGNPDVPRCGFSRKTVALLREKNVEFTTFDILSDESVRQGTQTLHFDLKTRTTNLKLFAGLKKLNDWPTFPQIIVNGELVGGLDILQDSVDSGEFAELMGQ